MNLDFDEVELKFETYYNSHFRQPNRFIRLPPFDNKVNIIFQVFSKSQNVMSPVMGPVMTPVMSPLLGPAMGPEFQPFVNLTPAFVQVYRALSVFNS